jgi:FkbM family methyltransferase
MRKQIRHFLQSAGYDLNPYPLPDWVVFRARLTALLARLRINCVFDVGAHDGDYAASLRRDGYDGWIFSFEPVAESFARLARRMQSDAKWRGFQLALGSRCDTRDIQVTRLTVFTSFLTRSDFSAREFGEESEVVRHERVDVRRLDTLFPQCTSLVGDARVFLKMDTQGFDIPVLEGTGCYRERVLGLQSELAVQRIYEGATGYLDALQRMTDMGFMSYAMVPVNRDRDGLVVEYDCLMARPCRSG